MDEAKERGKAPPTGEGVVLLQSTYRHPVQTTLVPHTNVCIIRMYDQADCGKSTRGFSKMKNTALRRDKRKRREKQVMEIY